MIDRKVSRVVDAALEGECAGRDDIVALLDVATGSPEAAYIGYGARVISERANEGRGQLFCQVGIDSNPCPENCVYCSYAACNSAINDPYELSIDEIVSYARLYDDLGIGLLSIMCTSAYDFEKYCDVIAAIRAAVRPDLPILANLGDIDEPQAERLAALGVQAAYHVTRVKEGRITGISPKRRQKTIDAWKHAGVKLMSCVEPVYAELEPEVIADTMLAIIANEPIETRVMSLSPVKGSKMEAYHGITLRRRGLINDIYRLAIGERVPFGGSESTVWVNAGANPKGRHFSKEAAILAEELRVQKRIMVGNEWRVSDRPLPDWFA